MVTMNLGKKIVIALIVIGILFIFTYPSSITGKLEAVTEPEMNSGEILSVEHEPEEPKFLESFTVTIVVKNNGQLKNDYLLDLKITKNGQLNYNDEMTFSLLPDSTITFSPTYVPNDIGEHEIIIRLYDKNKTKIYDEKILTFVSQSDVGPFDLEVDMPSRVIGIGDSLPASIKIKNVGVYGTDIGLNLDVECTGGDKISENMYIFVNGSSEIMKQIFMRTCGDVGQHTLTASLTLYNKELISSKNQFYVNATMPKVIVNTQELIKGKSGETTNFVIEVINLNGFDFKNIKPFVYGIPSDWLLIKPSSFNLLEPNESALFTVMLNIPENVETKTQEITIGIGSDNAYSKKESILELTGSSVRPSIDILTIYQLVSTYWIQITMILGFAVLIYLFLRWNKRRKEESHWNALKEKWKKKLK